MLDFILKEIVPIVLSIIAAALTKMYADIKRKQEVDRVKNEATQQGVKALLRNEIIKNYNEYMTLGYVPLYARENIAEMYKEYKNLNGNGAIDHLIEELDALPTQECKLVPKKCPEAV